MDVRKIILNEAKSAFTEGNVPVGAAIVRNNCLVSSSHNTKNTTNISINHAEILCIIEACKKLNTWHLDDCELYVTLKPCNMCLSAIAESRIKKVYYLLDSNYCDNFQSNYNNINIIKIDDISNEYNEIISNFFSDLR